MKQLIVIMCALMSMQSTFANEEATSNLLKLIAQAEAAHPIATREVKALIAQGADVNKRIQFGFGDPISLVQYALIKGIYLGDLYGAFIRAGLSADNSAALQNMLDQFIQSNKKITSVSRNKASDKAAYDKAVNALIEQEKLQTIIETELRKKIEELPAAPGGPSAAAPLKPLGTTRERSNAVSF